FHNTDLRRAFCRLNTRLNSLIYKQRLFHWFKFSSIKKNEFDQICQYHIPCVTNPIYDLCIDKDDLTPGKMDLFFTYFPSFEQFTKLQFLTLSHVPSPETLTKTIRKLPYLLHLTHLTIDCSIFRKSFLDLQLIIDTISNLPKLHHCSLHIYSSKYSNLCMSTKISSTLQSFKIRGCCISINHLEQLMKHTPHLKHLTNVLNVRNRNYVLPFLSTLVSLDISIYRKYNLSKLILLLKNLASLRCLELSINCNIINGYQ
ncbi:unnamed protein product, partial [Adineta steineri]